MRLRGGCCKTRAADSPLYTELRRKEKIQECTLKGHVRRNAASTVGSFKLYQLLKQASSRRVEVEHFEGAMAT